MKVLLFTAARGDCSVLELLDLRAAAFNTIGHCPPATPGNLRCSNGNPLRSHLSNRTCSALLLILNRLVPQGSICLLFSIYLLPLSHSEPLLRAGHTALCPTVNAPYGGHSPSALHSSTRFYHTPTNMNT